MKKLIKEWGGVAGVGLLILVVGFCLRIYNLTLWPVFADESIYIRWSQIMANEATLRFLPLSDGKQPLFMWILMFLIRYFSDPLFAGRLLSAATSIGTMLGLFAVSYVLLENKKIGLISMFLWAVSPFPMFFERMALVDSLLTSFAVWTMFFAILTAKTKRLDMAMLTGFTLGAAALTKSPALFIALMIPTTWLVSEIPKKGWPAHFIKLTCLLIPTYLIAFGMYNIQRLGPNFNLLSSRTADYVFPVSHLWENPKDPFIFHFHRALQFISIMGPSMVYVLLGIGVYKNYKKNFRVIILFLSWFLIPLLIETMFAKAFTARYILYLLPPFFILAAAAFTDKKKTLTKVAFLVLLIFVIQSAIFSRQMFTSPEKTNLPKGERAGYLEEWTAGTGIKEVAEYIKISMADLPAGRQVVVGSEGYFGTPLNALQMYLADNTQVTIIGVGINLKELPSSLAESKEAGNPTYLVINSSRLRGEPDEMGLKLIAEYPKALRRTDAHEYNLYGPQDKLFFFEVE